MCTSSGTWRPSSSLNRSFYVDAEYEGLVLQIDCQRLARSRSFSWRRSKRFRFGSLLIFSADGFASFGTGIVRHADHARMDRSMRRFGKCEVYAEVVDSAAGIAETFLAFRGRRLVVLESKAYFEAFGHTLETLKEMDRLPFGHVLRGCAPPLVPRFLWQPAYPVTEKNFFGVTVTRTVPGQYRRVNGVGIDQLIRG